MLDLSQKSGHLLLVKFWGKVLLVPSSRSTGAWNISFQTTKTCFPVASLHFFVNTLW